MISVVHPQTTAHGSHSFNINLCYIPSDDTRSLQIWVFSGYSNKKNKYHVKTKVEQKMKMATSHLSLSSEKMCRAQQAHTSHHYVILLI